MRACAPLAALALSLLSRAALAQPMGPPRRVLVYAGRPQDTDVMTRTVDHLRLEAEIQAGPARAEFTVANDAMWRSLTRADFASYHALWIDGASCTLTTPSAAAEVYRAAEETRDTWSSAITGHFEIIGSDSDYHITNHMGARRFALNSYHYVTSGAGTGLFVSTSCIYHHASADTPVPWLQGIGDFRVTGDGCSDGQRLEPGAERHPLHLGAAPPSSTLRLPSDLAWSCFTHSHFNRHPPSFQSIYAIGAGGASNGVVIVNDRGGCVVDADCVAGQYCNRDPRDGDPTCRPTFGLGRPCAADAQCTSRVCAGGVCCDRACGGACEACALAGSAGACTVLPAGSRPRDACVCDGSLGTCPVPDAGRPDVPPPDVPPPDVLAADVPPPDVPAPDVPPPDAAPDVCEGWRCAQDIRLEGRAGPLGGCGCRTLPDASSSARPAALLLALAFGRARRRRAGLQRVKP